VAKKINNKKVIIRNKEVAVIKEEFEYRLSQRQTPNTKQYIIREFVVTPAIHNQSPPWGI
jgi:hypothetical protein